MPTFHAHDSSRFSPFTYSIGLETSVAEAETLLQDYPLPKPIEEATFRKFMQSLTFVHEASHVVQHVSTAYGLRTLRYTLILLNALGKKPGWALPVLQTLIDRGKFTPDELRAVDASLLFLDAIDQMRLNFTPRDHNPEDPERIMVWQEVWSPHFFVGGAHDQSREERLEWLEKLGAHARNLPHLWMDFEGGAELVVNVAALMETYAVLAEWNHISNALTTDSHLGFAALPDRPEYRMLIDYARLSGVCSPATAIATLTTIIDASLMYDPFVLFDVPWDVVDTDGRADRYPGETFLELCEAAKSVDPIRRIEDVVPFHRAICKRAGLPEPQWMAEKALQTAQKVLDKTPDEKTLMRRALYAHRDALKIRCDRGSEQFAFDMPTTGTINEVAFKALPAISFFNVHTLQPEHFHIEAASIHSILFQAVAQKHIECPLKLGNPFFCPNGNTDSNTLCVWTDEGRKSECLVDILENDLELTPGDE